MQSAFFCRQWAHLRNRVCGWRRMAAATANWLVSCCTLILLLAATAPFSASQVAAERIVSPSARLQATPTTVYVGQPIHFTTTVQPEALARRVGFTYSFGDGAGSGPAQSSIDHAYTAPGTYAVSVRVYLGERGIPSQPVVVQVVKPPPPIASRAILRVTPTNTEANQTVRFTGYVQAPATKQQAIYTFIFGDGETSPPAFTNSVFHAYAGPGAYYALVQVRLGDRTIRSGPVLVQVQGPPRNTEVRVFVNAAPASSMVSQTVRFTGNVSPPQRQENVTYQFKWGDGSASEPLSSPLAAHAYARPGKYSVVLVLSRGHEPIASGQVEVQVAPPLQIQASLSAAPSNPRVNQTVRFLAEVQPGSMAAAARYWFDWGDGERSDWLDRAAAEHRYRKSGVYRVRLRVQVGDQLLEAVPAEISVLPPPLSLSLQAQPANVPVNTPVHFVGILKPRDTSSQVTYVFHWGDGSNSDPLASSVADHAYAQPGKYYAVLEASIGQQTARSQPVLLDIGPPVPRPGRLTLLANAAPKSQTGQPFTFTAFLKPGNRNAEYMFDFGDGRRSEWSPSSSASHSYSGSGIYRAIAMVRSPGGQHEPPILSNEVSITVGVEPPSRVWKAVLTLGALVLFGAIGWELLRHWPRIRVAARLAGPGIATIGSIRRMESPPTLSVRVLQVTAQYRLVSRAQRKEAV